MRPHAFDDIVWYGIAIQHLKAGFGVTLIKIMLYVCANLHHSKLAAIDYQYVQ